VDVRGCHADAADGEDILLARLTTEARKSVNEALFALAQRVAESLV
jgi:hypothetical protein